MMKAFTFGMGCPSTERVKRFRQRRSLELERMYLAKAWPERYKNFNAHQWAGVKRWFIFYARRRAARESGVQLTPWRPRHWAGPAERERKRAKLYRPTVNMAVVRHLSR